MSDPPFRQGDFIWCKYPLSEDPDLPGLNHVAYAVGVSAVAGGGYVAALAYTTTQIPRNLPVGARQFNETQAAAMGHSKPFVLNPRRLAYVPVNTAFFPQLNEPGHGIIGHASKGLQEAVKQDVIDLMTRRSEAIEQLGPLRPKPSKR